MYAKAAQGMKAEDAVQVGGRRAQEDLRGIADEGGGSARAGPGREPAARGRGRSHARPGRGRGPAPRRRPQSSRRVDSQWYRRVRGRVPPARHPRLGRRGGGDRGRRGGRSRAGRARRGHQPEPRLGRRRRRPGPGISHPGPARRRHLRSADQGAGAERAPQAGRAVIRGSGRHPPRRAHRLSRGGQPCPGAGGGDRARDRDRRRGVDLRAADRGAPAGPVCW